MLDDNVCGTYWYCVNGNGSRWLTNGKKPSRSGGFHSCDLNSTMGWLNLDSPDYYSIQDPRITTKAFKGVKFPERTYKDGPLEIEIVKSGKVYWYDN